MNLDLAELVAAYAAQSSDYEAASISMLNALYRVVDLQDRFRAEKNFAVADAIRAAIGDIQRLLPTRGLPNVRRSN